MNHKAAHEKLKKEAMIAVSATFSNVVAIPYDVGVARAFDNPKRVYKYGQDGVPDLMIIGPLAKTRFLDAKTGKSGFNTAQKNFKAAMLEVTGIDVVEKFKTVDEAINYILKEYPEAKKWKET